MQPQVLHFKR